MNALINKVQLTGNLGNDPKVFTFDNGDILVRTSMATSESYKNKKGEKVENTQWHNLVMRGQMAERAKRDLKKGAFIAVEGKLMYREYADKENIRRNITEIKVTDFVLTSGKSE